MHSLWKIVFGGRQSLTTESLWWQSWKERIVFEGIVFEDIVFEGILFEGIDFGRYSFRRKTVLDCREFLMAVLEGIVFGCMVFGGKHVFGSGRESSVVYSLRGRESGGSLSGGRVFDSRLSLAVDRR